MAQGMGAKPSALDIYPRFSIGPLNDMGNHLAGMELDIRGASYQEYKWALRFRSAVFQIIDQGIAHIGQ